MDKVIKEFHGHSGSQVYLMENEFGLYVRKNGNVVRNIERMQSLMNAGFPVPKIYEHNSETMTMQYIHGLDMKNYLIHFDTDPLIYFIKETIEKFKYNTKEKDYTEIYENKLQWMDLDNSLPFTKNELIKVLPKKLPQSIYHGDMTLENIMHTKKGFFFIDPVTVDFDSYIFDISKMRQDLECKWFLRNENLKLDVKLQNIKDELKQYYPQAFDDSILILMLLRVYVHCEKNDYNYNFIKRNIEKLWQNLN
jgi:RIO-like serine/threonine protein kinase